MTFGPPRRTRPVEAARGVTYVELLIVVSVMLILTLAVLPTGRTVHRRIQEKQLKRALHQIRSAIDEYHRDWERGHIESDNEKGWPEDLEELTREHEYDPMPAGAAPPLVGGSGPLNREERQRKEEEEKEQEPTLKVYLPAIPQDPFNLELDEWDTAGWRARSYDDELDSTTWGGDGLYDVYSSSSRKSLDGASRYEEW